MSRPNVQIWALPRGGPDVFLGDLGDFTISRVGGEIGTVQLDYPSTGAGFDVLLPVATQDRQQLEIEIRYDGTSATADRAILLGGKGDAITPGGTYTFSGLFLGVLMRAAVCPFEASGENGDTQLDGTPGVIVRTLMLRAQTRGALVDIDYTSFTNTHDSNGQPWAKQAVVRFSPGRDYASILAELEVDLELCEWELTSGRELRLYNPGTRGTDRTLPGAQVTLEHGRDLGDAPVTGSAEHAGTTVMAAGSGGLYTTVSNPTAEAELGRRIEVYKAFGSVDDAGTLQVLAEAEAQLVANGVHEQTHKLLLGEGPVPFLDYRVSDWVLRAVRGTTTRQRVAQLVLERQSGDVTASVTLGDLVASQEVKTRRMIEALSNGSGIVGTSTPPPASDDGKAPAAPTTLVVTSRAYYDGGTPLARLSAGWAPVTTNADGTAIGDLSGYQVEYAYQPGQDLPSGWQIAGITTATALTWSPVVQGKIVDVRVLAYDRFAHESAYSGTYTLTTDSDADAPPVLPAPAGSAYLGLLKWEWNGKGAAGEPMPGDFLHAELHRSQTANFTPHRPLLADGKTLDTAASTTYVDALTGAGVLPDDPGGAYGTTWYAKWVAVDRSHNASAASAQGSAVRAQAADGDIAAVNIGKLTTGILSALLTISGIIRTAVSGSRVELDTTGLRCIAADGRVLLEFNIPNSLLTIVGKVIAGAGVGLGATVVVDPQIAALDLHPNATLKRFRLRAWTSGLTGGGSGPILDLQAINASGQQRGPFIHMEAASDTTGLTWIGHTGTNGATQGGIVKLEQDGVAVIGTNNGFIQVNSDGSIDLRVPADSEIRSSVPWGHRGFGLSFFAQNGASEGYRWVLSGGELRCVRNVDNGFVGDGNGGLKSFVIPHPADPTRWLVHGCIEGPTADVLYRGEAVIVDGRAVVELPGYFEAATRPDGRQVQLTPVNELCMVAASTIEGGRFTVRCSGPDGTRVAWLVTAIRADVDPFDVEPLRSDAEVRGDGPYRYIVDPGQAA